MEFTPGLGAPNVAELLITLLHAHFTPLALLPGLAPSRSDTI